MHGQGVATYGRVLPSAQPYDVRNHMVMYSLRMHQGVGARATTPRRQARPASPMLVTANDDTRRHFKELSVASPRLGARPLRSVATPCRVQNDTPPRDVTSSSRASGSPCRTPPTPRSLTPSRVGTCSPIARGPINAIIAPVAGAVSSTCGSCPTAVPKASPPKPVAVPDMRFSSSPCQAFRITQSAQNTPSSKTREENSVSEASHRSFTAFDKLYDEDWWYRHLEDRRQGGAPPDGVVAGDEPEICLSARQHEGLTQDRFAVSDETQLVPQQRSGRIRLPAKGLVGADVALGGVRP